MTEVISTPDPPAIAHLRDKLAHEHDLPGASPGAPFATIIGRSMRALGVRPRVVEHRADGTKVYLLTRGQAQRVVKRYDEAMAATTPQVVEPGDERNGTAAS